jgi:hypothetical protein
MKTTPAQMEDRAVAHAKRGGLEASSSGAMRVPACEEKQPKKHQKASNNKPFYIKTTSKNNTQKGRRTQRCRAC